MAIPFEDWAAIDQNEAKNYARDPELNPLFLRVFFASLGWANLAGHANFERDQLAKMLASPDSRTGELKTPSASVVSQAITAAKGRRLIAPESSARCLVTPSKLIAKNGGKGGSACKIHSVQAKRRKR